MRRMPTHDRGGAQARGPVSQRDLARLCLRSGAAWGRMLRARADLRNPRFIFYGLAGATRFVRAIAAGDIADDATIDARRRVCAACPARTMHDGAAYCGEAFVDRMGEPEPTCGCLIEGKTAVASEACPRGLWPRVTAPGA